MCSPSASLVESNSVSATAREPDLGAGGRGQLEVARKEVSMEVRLDDQFDRQTGRLGVADVLVDVASRVDHDRTTRRLVADQVRRLRETIEVVLREDHAGAFRLEVDRDPVDRGAP